MSKVRKSRRDPRYCGREEADGEVCAAPLAAGSRADVDDGEETPSVAAQETVSVPRRDAVGLTRTHSPDDDL